MNEFVCSVISYSEVIQAFQSSARTSLHKLSLLNDIYRSLGWSGPSNIKLKLVWPNRRIHAILCACSLETRRSFYNLQTDHDVKMKLTSIDFSRRVTKGCRSPWLQILDSQLIHHSPSLLTPQVNAHIVLLALKLSYILLIFLQIVIAKVQIGFIPIHMDQ